jgi:hypothetical protein
MDYPELHTPEAKMRTFAIALLSAVVLATQASAGIITYTDTMLGVNETPSNGSTATGSATVVLDTTLNTLNVSIIFSGLTGGVAAASHIHCCVPAGVAGIVALPFTGFPAATSGSYLHLFDLTLLATYNGAFVTANGGTAASAEAALVAGLNAGLAYTNIHDQTFPGGEIRGQLAATPEPATMVLSGAGLLLAALLRRRRR